MYVCVCNGVTDHDIRKAANAGCGGMAELTMRTGCGSACGSCVATAREILDSSAEASRAQAACDHAKVFAEVANAA